ncbi:6-carboxytetrahydropterin synthase QueD [Verrucomicrobiota bacterium]
MFEVSVRMHFSAAHHLEGYRGGCEEQHGHNWEVEVFVGGDALDEIGMLVDFRDVKGVLAAELDRLDHHDLNTLDVFGANNPTSERIAEFLFNKLSRKLNTENRHVSRVSVQETPGAKASYSG